MIRRTACIVLLAPAMLLTGCQCFMHCGATRPAGAKVTLRNQGYALLYSTIDDESQIDQVLMIKDPNPQVADLLKAIAQFCGDTKTILRGLAKEDPTLCLDNQGLPEVEAGTRDAISGATARQILFSGGKEFEFRILLTQHEALNYITYLATTLSEQETHEVRKHYLAQLAEDASTLHERVIAQLEAPYVGPPK